MRTEYSAPQFARDGSFDFVAKLWDDAAPKYYKMFTSDEKAGNRTVIVGTEGNFATALEVDQGDDFPVQDFQTPFQNQYIPRKRGLAFMIATEVLSTDKYGIISDRTEKMVDAIERAQEYDAAEFLTGATNSAIVQTPDLQALASASHPLQSGTTSNILSGNPVLSYSSLSDMETMLINQPNHTGDPMGLVGPYILLVPPALRDLANRLTAELTPKLPQTLDNDGNFAGKGIEVVVDPYANATTTAWALIVKRKNPLKMYRRRALKTDSFPGGLKDSMIYMANQIWVKVPQDFRGFGYSAGA